MTLEKRELLRLCRDALETPISERHRDSWAVQAKQLARDMKSLLTDREGFEAQGETPKREGFANRGTWTDPKWVTFNAMQWRALKEIAANLDELIQADESLCVCDYGDASVGMPPTTCDAHALAKLIEEVLQDNFPPPAEIAAPTKEGQ